MAVSTVLPLMPRLPAEQLGYVLRMLAATRDPAARPIIASCAGRRRRVRAQGGG